MLLFILSCSLNFCNRALSRGYLIHGMRCQRSEPLIKKVIAVPGDNVMLSKQFIKVNGQTFPYPTLSKDSHGRRLNIYPAGNYFNTKDYWVIGTDSTRSWDSRYFGPIPADALLWKIKPVLIFSKTTQKKSPMKHCTLVFGHNITLHNVPMAETIAQQKKGLSGQDNVTKGMFFTFKNPQRLAFWMKDTTQALSIGFFDVSGRLINIEDMEPSSTELYFSASDAVSALELPKGQFQKNKIQPGNRLLKHNCH